MRGGRKKSGRGRGRFLQRQATCWEKERGKKGISESREVGEQRESQEGTKTRKGNSTA
jgi:hypothetical protein